MVIYALLLGLLAVLPQSFVDIVIVLYVFAIVVVSNYYRNLGKMTINKVTARNLSLLVCGLGQFHIRANILGAGLALTNAIILYLATKEINGEVLLDPWVSIAMVVFLTVVSVFHISQRVNPLGSPAKSKEEAEKIVAAKFARMKKAIDHGADFALDTSILMLDPLLFLTAYKNSEMKIYLSDLVITEIDELLEDEMPSVRKKAETVKHILGLYEKSDRLVTVPVPDEEFLAGRQLGTTENDKLIGSYIAVLQEDHYIVFMSNDIGAMNLVRSCNMPFLEV